MSAPPATPGQQTAPLQLLTCWQDGDVTITLRGELDYATAPLLADQITSAIARQAGRVVLDLTDLTFIDCSGLAPIIRARRCLPAATPLILKSPAPAVRSLLARTGVDLTAGLYCA